MKFVSKVLLTLATSLLVFSCVSTQTISVRSTTTLQPSNGDFANPFRYLHFNAQDVAQFFWESLRPEYQSSVVDNLPSLLNISQLMIELSMQALGENTTARLLQYELTQTLMEAVDNEFLSLFQNMDFQSGNLTEILIRLSMFDVTKLQQAATTGVLWEMQSMLPNVTQMLSSIIYQLENDMPIADDLVLKLEPLIGAPCKWMNLSMMELDDALHELVDQIMRTEGADWVKMSDLEKMMLILKRFDYRQFGDRLISSVYETLDSELPAMVKLYIRELLFKLQTFQPLELSVAANQMLPVLYNYTRNKLLEFNCTWLPEQTLDFQAMEFFGVYIAIEEGLRSAMMSIMSQTNGSYVKWMDTVNVTDLERLSMLLCSLDSSVITESLMGSLLNMISDDNMIQSFLQQLVHEMYSSVNMTEGNEALINSTANLAASALQQSIVTQSMAANWTSLTRSQQLMAIANGVDCRTLLMQLVVAVVHSGESRLPAECRGNATEMMALIDSSNERMIESFLEDGLDQMSMGMLKGSMPALIEDISRQLISTNQLLIDGDNETLAYPLLMSSRTPFSTLTDSEKMFYLSISLDYAGLSQLLMEELQIMAEGKAEAMLNKLANEESITPDMKNWYNFTTVSWMNGTMDFDMLNEFMEVMMINLDDQLVDKYSILSQQDSWLSANHTNMMKMMDLLSAYDWSELGMKILQTSDDFLSPNASMKLEEFIERVGNNESVRDLLEDMRSAMVEMSPMMDWVTEDSMKLIYDWMDSHIHSLGKNMIDEWKLLPGKLPKIVMFLSSLNSTEMMNTLMATAQRCTMNWIVDVVSLEQPWIIETVSELMNAVENDGLHTFVVDMMKMVPENNTMVSMLMDCDVVWSIIDSVLQSMDDAYKKAVLSARARWSDLSSMEKLLRLIMEIDPIMMASDAMEAGQQAVIDTLTYYGDTIWPKYSQQCSWDMSNVTNALTNPIEENLWAGKMLDSWGKIPSGVMLGRFIWPGDMNECENVKGRSVRVLESGETVVVREDGIKGAWSMAVIEVAEGASLQWGFCLPDSCDYEDSLKFIGRVKLLGVNVSYIKSRSEYPAIKGDYKTDSKFIIVSVFFVLLIALVTMCSIVDRMMMMKLKGKQSKENAYVIKSSVPSENNGAVLSNGTEKDYMNGGYVHSPGDEKQNGVNNDLEAASKEFDHPPTKQEKSRECEPGVGVKLIKSFSLYQTLPRLMDSSAKPNQLQALDGIRFLSITWVVLGHTYSFPFAFIQNPAVIASMGANGDWTFMGIYGGVYAVDSFFLLSGLLVAYLFLKTLDKVKGKLTCLTLTLYYVHRVLRLLPLYAGTILISVAYSNYFGTGPFHSWYDDDKNENPCENNWWTNLLYINNVYREREMCVGWSWYLANDMQFYVISPIFIVLLYWFPKVGVTSVVVAWAGHIGLTGWEWSKRNGGSLISDLEIFMDIYIKPWYRIGPYLIGLLLGFVLFKKCKVKSCIAQGVWWLMSLGVIASCVYFPYDATKEAGISTSSWDVIQRTTYETLARSGWAVALGWIIFACNTGCGGVIGDALGWSGWAPLSRLTYAVYLIHPFVMFINYSNMHTLVYIDHLSLFYQNMSYVTISYLAAGVLHLLLEAPMMGIEKIMLPKRK